MSANKKIRLALRRSFFELFVPAKDPFYIYGMLGGITLLAFLVRLYYMHNPIGYDEAYTFIRFSSKPFRYILADYHAPNNHILNSLLIGIVYRIVGNQLWVVRVPAFVASILAVPAAFLLARRSFNAYQALAAASALALWHAFIMNAVNGRGYSLIILFSLLLANFGSILLRKESRAALVAYALTGALGFYTIPIFLYPMAGISLWVAVGHLTEKVSWRVRWHKLRQFLLACLVSGLLTLALYSPVIIFGTGFDSIVSNEIVKSQSWSDFVDNFITRSQNTWLTWDVYENQLLTRVITGGFIISLFIPRHSKKQKWPLAFFLVLSAGLILLMQRVAPLPRIWGYLEMFYLFFSAIGLAWLVNGLFSLLTRKAANEKTRSIFVFFVAVLIFSGITLKTQNKAARANNWIAPEYFVAEYIHEHLGDADAIIAVAPSDIQTAYYLSISGVPYEIFYQRDNPVEIDKAFVLVRTRGSGKLNSLDAMLNFFQFENLVADPSEPVLAYGPLLLYSVSAQ